MKNCIKRCCIIVTVLLLLVSGSAMAEPRLLIAPDDTTVVVNHLFQIQIEADSSIQGLMGYDISITFDSTVVKLVGVDEGTLPGSGGAPTFFHWFGPGVASGHVRVNGAVLGTTVDGPGTLFLVTFKGLREGTTAVTFVSPTELRDNLNATILHGTTGGSITVEEPIPTHPVTWGSIKNLYQ